MFKTNINLSPKKIYKKTDKLIVSKSGDFPEPVVLIQFDQFGEIKGGISIFFSQGVDFSDKENVVFKNDFPELNGVDNKDIVEKYRFNFKTNKFELK